MGLLSIMNTMEQDVTCYKPFPSHKLLGKLQLVTNLWFAKIASLPGHSLF